MTGTPYRRFPELADAEAALNEAAEALDSYVDRSDAWLPVEDAAAATRLLAWLVAEEAEAQRIPPDPVPLRLL